MTNQSNESRFFVFKASNSGREMFWGTGTEDEARRLCGLMNCGIADFECFPSVPQQPPRVIADEIARHQEDRATKPPIHTFSHAFAWATTESRQ